MLQLEKELPGPSFGGSAVSAYNKRRYSKYISQFHALSVREVSGANIIRNLIGKDAEVLSDPVTLFTGDQWRKKYEHKATFNVECKYICLFFIDQISEVALEFALKRASETGTKILSFGYKYNVYESI